VGDVTVDHSVKGVYELVFMMMTALLTVCCYFNPHGSALLVAILAVVVAKLGLNVINAWTRHTQIQQASGVLGVFVCLLAVYSFFAESLAEHGSIIPTGKFGEGVVSRTDVKAEMMEGKKSQ